MNPPPGGLVRRSLLPGGDFKGFHRGTRNFSRFLKVIFLEFYKVIGYSTTWIQKDLSGNDRPGTKNGSLLNLEEK
jgi:hypothetical protein